MTYFSTLVGFHKPRRLTKCRGDLGCKLLVDVVLQVVGEPCRQGEMFVTRVKQDFR